MSTRKGTREKTDPNGAVWINLPRTGHVQIALDDNGAADVAGVDPEFGDVPYCVHLGFRASDREPIRYGTLDSPVAGDHFYAEVPNSGPFSIHVKASNFRNTRVTIVWWATPLSSTCMILTSYTLGPTPYLWPDHLVPVVPADVKDSGRSVTEVPDIGGQEARHLTSGGIQSLDALARAAAAHVAHLLNISEVRAMGFIDQARRLVQG